MRSGEVRAGGEGGRLKGLLQLPVPSGALGAGELDVGTARWHPGKGRVREGGSWQ